MISKTVHWLCYFCIGEPMKQDIKGKVIDSIHLLVAGFISGILIFFVCDFFVLT